MRLDKYLADANLGTRSRVKEIIKQKNISVDEKIITDPGYKITDGQLIRYKGELIKAQTSCYYMFHKPGGCVSATVDAQKTVLDYFSKDAGKELFPVGRLDKDTEGLLLVTNDGAFSHKLMSPGKHVSKLYYFEGAGTFVKDTVSMLEHGMDIGDDKITKPAKILYRSQKETHTTQTKNFDVLSYLENELSQRYGTEEPNSEIGFSVGLIEITEGRYHQVKRMLFKCGVRVTYLKRIAIGQLFLDLNLKPGEYRALTKQEFALLDQKIGE